MGIDGEEDEEDEDDQKDKVVEWTMDDGRRQRK
jgi:hypothetical protein